MTGVELPVPLAVVSPPFAPRNCPVRPGFWNDGGRAGVAVPVLGLEEEVKRLAYLDMAAAAVWAVEDVVADEPLVAS